MPIYEYKCDQCSHTEEVFEKYEDINNDKVCNSTDNNCFGYMLRQIGLRSKPLVSDRDLVNARKHNGKM